MAKAKQGSRVTAGQGTISTAALTCAVIVFAPVASADNRTAAPIVFGKASNTPIMRAHEPAQPIQYASAPSRSASYQQTQTSVSGRAVEYRYPDRPDMVYSAGGARQTSGGGAPIAFSSSTSAVSVEAARKVSHSYAPTPTQRQAMPLGREYVQQKVAYTQKTAPSGEHAKQKIGRPYQISGKWYVPTAEPNYDEVGMGSWYGPKFHGKPSATGEIFDQNALTAAHPTLPIPSLARVTNLENGQSIVVRINDRGPFVDDRIIDLSKKSAAAIGYEKSGTAKVRVQYLGLAPKEHNTVPAKYEKQALAQLAANQSRSNNGAPGFMKAAYKSTPLAALNNKQSKPGFYLQMGAFSELSNAHAHRAKLHAFGKPSVKEVRSNGRELFKVMLGPWPSKHAAENARVQLTQNGFDSIIVAAK